jgi:chemosensory pili system protein ChpA (sensor histidine kinase/response regulator)
MSPPFSGTGAMVAWVREDLDKFMDQLRRQLEHLGGMSNPPKEMILETSDKIDKLRLTFETLDIHGACMVTAEMISVCRQLSRHRVDNLPKAFGALLEAMVILASYLDRLQAGHEDLPALLLPLVNVLRDARQEKMLQPSSMFNPDLDVDLPDLEASAASPPGDETFAEVATRLRGQYENALLNWTQEQDSTDLLSPLQGICETLMHRVRRIDLRRLWWVASELVGGLADGYTRNDPHMRRLFARMHLVLKKLSEGGESAIDETVVNALTRDLLFQVAGARRGHGSLEHIRARFNLNEAFTDENRLAQARGAISGQNRDMYRSLGAAIQDELALVKDSLDLELRTGAVDQDRRDQSRAALERLQDALLMLGLAGATESLDELLLAFDRSATAGGDARETALVSLAERLLLLESVVSEQVATLGEPLDDAGDTGFIDLPAHEQRQVVTRLLDETVASVHQLQEGIRTRFGGTKDADLATPLEELAGALEMIGDTGAAELASRLLDATVAVLGEAVSEAAIPAWQLERFTDAVAALELYLAACRDQQAGRDRFAEVLRERLDTLASGEQPPERPGERPAPDPGTATEAPPAVTVETAPLQGDGAALDPELLEVFLEEYDAVSESLQQHLPDWLAKLDDVRALTEVRRGFHTLKGSGRMVGAFELGDFAWQIEEMLNALLDARIDAFADAAVTVRLAQAALPALKQRLLQQPAGLEPEAIEAISAHAEYLTRTAGSDWNSLRDSLPGFLASMLPDAPPLQPEPAAEEGEAHGLVRRQLAENLVHIQALLEAVSADRNAGATEEQVRAANDLASVLATQPDGRESEIARALGRLLAAQISSGAPFCADAVWALGSSLGHLQAKLDRLDGHAVDDTGAGEEELLQQLEALALGLASPAPAEPTGPGDLAAEAPRPPEPAGEPADEPPDAGIMEIFQEEAREVLARSDGLLNRWRDDLEAIDIVQSLQRELHTFKGGARMAGLTDLGDLGHAMESLLERIAGRELPPSEAAIQLLEGGCDRLQDWLEAISSGGRPDDAAETIAFFVDQCATLEDGPAANLETVPDAAAAAPQGTGQAPGPGAPQVTRELQAPGPATQDGESRGEGTRKEEPREVRDLAEDVAAAVEPAGEAGSHAHIRVDADLLDSLVNAAGEISILRTRLERQVSKLRANLGEFDETLGRLREQFRKLEIETETQIRSRYHDAGDDAEGFDPLELDRFSAMQQLSRGLSESVADLLNLQELLDDSARQSEVLLTQQSRFGTELQEGLLRTRMVPFGSIAPRLRRVVRTAARETDKKCRLRLQVAGASDQLDRNVLERITAPLEHMLRNAIAHGIETPEARAAAGKPPEGEIRVKVESEATEFVIRIEDDGAGIDLAAIRERAVARGLIAAEADPPPQQLFEFMLHSGFTTSETVTGLAGRGVGMDVVSSEIKQIGGSLEIASEEGRGTRFTIRIPFTLAVMQAIGLVAGENRYLVPLAGVAGVARIAPDDYLDLLEQEAPVYEFNGSPYPVLDLETMLGEPPRALGGDNVSLLMISAGNQKAALRVPRLTGHREIVIKPVGPQISSVPGILGGTVTGDGQVVVILDPGPLIRRALLHGARPATTEPVGDDRPRRHLAMVVDDSITMRKVTSRVLQGEGFEVMTARDGVDATEQLQNRIPDLLLLDIEMPRMDGYAVAEYVRSDSRLRHIPIMMITSRSGQKHRDRARQAGADAYLTKPYKEAELLMAVAKLLDRGGNGHGS